jgi:hypothetical protein
VETPVRSAALVLLAAALVLAGCFEGDPGLPPASTEDPEPDAPRFRAQCRNALLLQFVEYGDTDPYLPPGFHPSDAQEFLNVGPVAFGQSAVLFLMVACPGEPAYSAATVDVFVEAPQVPGLEPARFNFYELERYGDAGPLAGVLADAGWPQVPAEVSIGPQDDGAPGAEGLVANVTDGAGLVVDVLGAVATPLPLGPSLVRFWHDGPKGLAYVEYEAVLDPIVGNAYCSLRPGTAFAAFMDGPLPAAGGRPTCPPGDPIAATFPALALNATARLLPGVRAG